MNDLETRLTEAFQADVARPDVDDFLTGVRRGSRVRRARRNAAAAVTATVAAVALVAAFTSAHHGARSAPPVHQPTTSVSLPPGATSQVLDVAVMPAAVLRLTTNVGCVGCSTVWERTGAGGWQHLFDFSGRSAYGGKVDPLFGPVSYLQMAPDGRNGFAWGARLWSTHDGGHSWQLVTDGPGDRTDRGHWTWSGPHAAWSVYDGRLLWRTALGSDTWHLVDPPEIGTVAGVLPDDRVVLLTYPGEGSQGRLVYGSGTSWKNIGLPCAGGGPHLDDPTPTPVVHGTTVFAVCGRRIESTDLDGLATWTVLGKFTGSVQALLPLDDRRVLVQTREVAVYDDRGAHPVDLRPAPGEQLLRISTEGESAWVVGMDGSLFSSADGGSTWTRVE
jgi:hypothetical protein